MMKCELEKMLNREVTQELYDALDTIYMTLNLPKEEFAKKINPMLPLQEQKKNIKRMCVRDKSGYSKTPNGCYFHIQFVELCDIDVTAGKYLVKALSEVELSELQKNGNRLDVSTDYDFDFEKAHFLD